MLLLLVAGQRAVKVIGGNGRQSAERQATGGRVQPGGGSPVSKRGKEEGGQQEEEEGGVQGEEQLEEEKDGGRLEHGSDKDEEGDCWKSKQSKRWRRIEIVPQKFQSKKVNFLQSRPTSARRVPSNEPITRPFRLLLHLLLLEARVIQYHHHH